MDTSRVEWREGTTTRRDAEIIPGADRHVLVVPPVDVDTGVRHRKPKQQQDYFDGVVASITRSPLNKYGLSKEGMPLCLKI